jgi:hypothetical protein
MTVRGILRASVCCPTANLAPALCRCLPEGLVASPISKISRAQLSYLGKHWSKGNLAQNTSHCSQGKCECAMLHAKRVVNMGWK